jgi:hypothetical protein
MLVSFPRHYEPRDVSFIVKKVEYDNSRDKCELKVIRVIRGKPTLKKIRKVMENFPEFELDEYHRFTKYVDGYLYSILPVDTV